MHNYRLMLFISLITFTVSFTKQNTKKYCGREYIEKKTKIYLKDENIWAEMMQVLDKKTKKLVFSYFINAIRNDTNFIYSKISVRGDTLLNTTYRKYNISRSIDCSISKYICTKKALIFYGYQSYKDGQIRVDQKFNRVLNRY